jgi:hypothetical protein
LDLFQVKKTDGENARVVGARRGEAASYLRAKRKPEKVILTETESLDVSRLIEFLLNLPLQSYLDRPPGRLCLELTAHRESRYKRSQKGYDWREMGDVSFNFATLLCLGLTLLTTSNSIYPFQREDTQRLPQSISKESHSKN